MFVGDAENHTADTCEPLSTACERGEVRIEALSRRAYPGGRLPRNVLNNVCSIGFWDAAFPQQWGLGWHRNEGLEITFLESGKLAFATGGNQYDVKPGTLMITRPWQPHRVGDPRVGASRLHWLILDLAVRRPNQSWRWPPWLLLAPDDVARLTEMLRHNEHAVWPTDKKIRRCWEEIGAAVQNDVNGSSHSRLRIRISELLLLIAEMLVRNRPPLDPSLTSSARVVELFLSELRHNEQQRRRLWSVAEMADRCGLGVTRFSALCHQLTNRTPTRYLTGCRMEAARELLRQNRTLSITEVAFACGFSSSQYFAASFLREHGMTPSAFRAHGCLGHAANRIQLSPRKISENTARPTSLARMTGLRRN